MIFKNMTNQELGIEKEGFADGNAFINYILKNREKFDREKCLKANGEPRDLSIMIYFKYEQSNTNHLGSNVGIKASNNHICLK